jgi:hypothetical protein
MLSLAVYAGLHEERCFVHRCAGHENGYLVVERLATPCRGIGNRGRDAVWLAGSEVVRVSQRPLPSFAAAEVAAASRVLTTSACVRAGSSFQFASESSSMCLASSLSAVAS